MAQNNPAKNNPNLVTPETPNDDLPNFVDEQKQQDDVENFIKKLQDDFAQRDFTQLSPQQAQVLAAMPRKLQEYLQIIEQIKKEKARDKNIKDPTRIAEKQKENAEKLQKLSKEVLIIACAASDKIPMKDVLKFAEDAKIKDTKNLSEFSNANGLNPLAAALAGNRNPQDLKDLIEAGADVNAKSPLGENAAHFAAKFNVKPELFNVLTEVNPPVDLNAKNAAGMTPRDIAVINGNEVLDKAMAEKGGKLDFVAQQQKQAQEEEKLERAQLRRQMREERSRNLQEEKPNKSPSSSAQGDNKLQEAQKQAQEAAKKQMELAAQRENIMNALAMAEERMANYLKAQKDKKAADQKLTTEKSKEQAEIDAKSAAELAAKNAEIKPATQEPVVSNQEKTKEIGKPEKEFLKQFGIDLEKHSIHTLLFHAASQGQTMVAQMLLTMGADVNHKENGKTIFEAALNNNNPALVGILTARVSPESLKLATEKNSNIGNKELSEKEIEKETRQSKDNSMNPPENLKGKLEPIIKKLSQQEVEKEVSPSKGRETELSPRAKPSNSPEPKSANILGTREIQRGVNQATCLTR